MPPSAASRSNKQSNPAGSITFIGLRLLSPLVQYSILARGAGDALISGLGGKVLASGVQDSIIPGLSTDRAVVFSMSAVAALKHIIYITCLTQSRTEVGWALEQSAYNGISDTISSLLFICAQTSPIADGPFPQTTLLVGTILFVLGISLELGGEVQRYRFKRDAANKGKLYQGGLFALSRHVNYLGFTVWRAGYTIASAGWSLAAVSTVWASASFIYSSIPDIEKYLAQRYGQQYEHYKSAVPYAFIPFVY